MMPGRDRALSFGREAAAYDAVRPIYPVEAADVVLSLTATAVAVEVGAGTGKTTEAFARSGLEIVCIEPDLAMAGVLASRDLPGVRVVVEGFETWPGPESPVDLVFAGQTWHWLDRETACPRAFDWLRPGGVLALLWNIPAHRYDRFQAAYEAHAPHLLQEGDRRIHFRDSTDWIHDMVLAGFADVALTTFTWSERLGPAEVRLLYSTYSDHIALESQVRERLLDSLEQEVRERGGSLEIEYETRVFTGRRP